MTSIQTATFTHTALPARVLFGRGTLSQVPDEIDRLGLRRVMVLCTPHQERDGQRVADLLRQRCAGVYPEAVMHVPTAVADAAIAHAQSVAADGLIAVGGGSSVGLGKAIARVTALPLVAVPTTYAGSEMTPVWGLTNHDGKTTGRDIKVLPVSVIYDVDLTLGLPVETSVTSAVNALAHAVEALYAPDSSPLIDLSAQEACRALISGIRRIAVDSDDLAARTELLYGAWLAGSCLGSTMMSLHHKLCHIVGGTFNLSHAWTHTVILPHVMAFNLRPGTRAHRLVADVLNDEQPGAALWNLLSSLGWMRSLANIGMPVNRLDVLVKQATTSPYANPFQVTAQDVHLIVGNAWQGRRPHDHR